MRFLEYFQNRGITYIWGENNKFCIKLEERRINGVIKKLRVFHSQFLIKIII